MVEAYELMRYAILFSLFLYATTVSAQGVYTAATPNQSDVAACITGTGSTCILAGGGTGSHTMVNGDTILIPAGTSTAWDSSGITLPSGVAGTITGTGTPNNSPGSNPETSASCQQTILTGNVFFTAFPTYVGSTTPLMRISCISFKSPTGQANNIALTIYGNCTTASCPNFRMDNLTVPNDWSWDPHDATFANVSDVFGVADHNTIGSTAAHNGNGVDFINAGMGTWLSATGGYGDLSWASPSTIGTSQVFFLEDNVFTNAFGTDSDIGSAFGGGARVACRFNTFNGLTPSGACSGHGTDTTGRPRGIQQWEGIWNTGTCTNTAQGCGSMWPGRSGTGMSFANTVTNVSGGFFETMTSIGAQRRWRLGLPWGACDGSSPWDTDDGVVYYPSSGTVTIAAATGIGYTTGTKTTVARSGSGTGFTLNVTAVDAVGGITASSIGAAGTGYAVGNTLSVSGGASNDQAAVVHVLTVTSGAVATYSLHSFAARDTSATWTVHQWQTSSPTIPYSFHDITAGYGFPILDNQPTYLIPQKSCNGNGCFEDNSPGDSYQILRASVCMDQPARGDGLLVQNTTPVLASTGLPGAVSEVIQPIYEADDTMPSTASATIGLDIGYAYYRDVYAETPRQAANTTNTSPFNGSNGNGAGHGLYANRPTSCTTGAGYWATDQGTWNVSATGANVGLKGALYICTAGGVFPAATSPSYQPAVYPNPLISGPGQASAPSCSPGGGTYTSAQTVTCTNPNTGTTVICVRTDGGAPATNGTGNGCVSPAVLYTAALTVSATQTVTVVAGTSTLSDSNEVLYSYVINSGGINQNVPVTQTNPPCTGNASASHQAVANPTPETLTTNASGGASKGQNYYACHP